MGKTHLKPIPFCRQDQMRTCENIFAKRGPGGALQSWELISPDNFVFIDPQNPTVREFEDLIFPSLKQYKDVCRTQSRDLGGNYALFVCKGGGRREEARAAGPKKGPKIAPPPSRGPSLKIKQGDPDFDQKIRDFLARNKITDEARLKKLLDDLKKDSEGGNEIELLLLAGMLLVVIVAGVRFVALYNLNKRIGEIAEQNRGALHDMGERLEAAQRQSLEKLEARLESLQQDLEPRVGGLNRRLQTFTMRLRRVLGQAAQNLREEQKKLREELTRLKGEVASLSTSEPTSDAVRELQAKMETLERGVKGLEGLIQKASPQSVTQLAFARFLTSMEAKPEIKRWIEGIDSGLRYDIYRSVARIWENNEGLRRAFPFQDGKPNPSFVEIAVAIIGGDRNTLNRITTGDANLEGLVKNAWDGEQTVRRSRAPQPAPVKLGRRVSGLRRMHHQTRIHSRARRWFAREPVRNGAPFALRELGVSALPWVALDAAEHARIITPAQKSFYLLSWLGGLTYYNRYTPAQVTLLAPSFGLGQKITEAGLKTAGVSPDSLGYKIGGTLGGFAGAEGMIYWTGKTAGAATFPEAHALGAKVIQDASVHAVKSLGSFLSRSTAVLKTGAAAVFNFASRVSANSCLLPLLFVTPEMLKGINSRTEGSDSA